MEEKSTKILKKLEAYAEKMTITTKNIKMKKETTTKKATFSEELKQNGSQCSPLPG